MLLSDDYPHTIPARAYLTWRENWFFIFLDPDNQFYCIAHMSVQPTMGTGRATCSISFNGEHQICAEEAASPADWERLKTVELGRLTFEFIEAQSRFRVSYQGLDFSVVLDLRARMKMFDYQACQSANPDQMSVAEQISCGGTDFRHQNQLLDATGTIQFKTGLRAGLRLHVAGPAYRDHSWGLRNDLGTLSHTWSFMIFKDRVFHVMKINNRRRPESWVFEGYSGTRIGNLALRTAEAHHEGVGPEGMPAKVRFAMVDTEGERFTVDAQVSQRLAAVPFYSQKPGAQGYLMIENFCECELIETGEKGMALIEIGSIQSAREL